MERCRSPDGVTSISVRPYYTMLSRVYLALAMGFLVDSMTYAIGLYRAVSARNECLNAAIRESLSGLVKYQVVLIATQRYQNVLTFSFWIA